MHDERPSTPHLVLSRRTLIIAGLGLGASLLSADEAFADEEALKALLGGWKHVGGDRERAERDRAIDDVVDGMSVIARGIARDKLREANPNPGKLDLAADAKQLVIAMDKRTYKAPRDGSSVKVKAINGDEMDMRFKIGKGGLDQIFSAEDKGRVNAYRTSDNRLVLHVRIHASRLPKDLKYKLTYERA